MGVWTGGGQGGGGVDFPQASMIAAGPPPGTNPLKLGGRVPARWTYPYAGYGQPLLELPQNRFMRISLGVNAYLGEPIINSAAKLTIFLAMEKMQMTVQAHCSERPDWIPEDKWNRYAEEYGNDPAQIAAMYVKQECLNLLEYLDVKTFMENEALDVLVSGDGYINIASNASPEEESAVWNAENEQETVIAVKELKAKMLQDGRGQYKIECLQGLNPSAVWLYPDYAGRITHAKVVHLMGEGVWDINLNNLIHLKPFSFQWVIYGISHYISALKWVDIKFKLMDATYVNAKRYVTPREWLKIQGPKSPEGAELPPTEQQMEWAEQILEAYNMEQPYVLPMGWDWQYLGAEGKVLRVEGLMEKTDDAIRTAAQVSRTFTSGAANVPAYATSKLQAGVMMKALNPLREMISRAVEGRILQRYCLFRGFFDTDGSLISPKVQFTSLPIQGDDSIEKKITALGALGYISPTTAWELEGLDPSIEMDRINRAREGLVEPFRSIAPDLSPSQSPDRYNDLYEKIQEETNDLRAAKTWGNRKLNHHLINKMNADANGDKRLSEEEYYNINKYLIQAQYLMQSDAKNRLDHAIDWEDQIKEQEEVLKENDGNGSVLRKYAVVSSEVRRRDDNGHS